MCATSLAKRRTGASRTSSRFAACAIRRSGSSPSGKLGALVVVAGAQPPLVIAARLLRRPSLETRRGQRAHLGREHGAARAALLRFLVESRGHGCRPAHPGQTLHGDVMLERRLGDRDAVAELERLGGLRTLAVDRDVARVDRLHRERARLEEARRPQPLVDAHGDWIPAYAGMTLRRIISAASLRGA